MTCAEKSARACVWVSEETGRQVALAVSRDAMRSAKRAGKLLTIAVAVRAARDEAFDRLRRGRVTMSTMRRMRRSR